MGYHAAMDPVRDYHERSKHHLDRYAPGPGVLDWPAQPDPFRRYGGTPETPLPLLDGELGVHWDALFGAARPSPCPLDGDHIAQLLELSLGLSAWKSYAGSRWALRCNPSSGNLHPTEAYLICPELAGVAAGVHHYRPDTHSLEHRAAAPLAWSGGVFVALTGIHWREAWKYGMRAFRYCQHDCGHALAALAYAAAALGWPSRLVEDWGDEQLAALTGVDRQAEFPPDEDEAPEALLWIGAGPLPAAREVRALLAPARWAGRAEALSRTHRDWPDVAAVAAAKRWPDPGTEAAEHQDIASDSAFALAMLARFDDIAASPWRYRQRFWEAGLLGQVLYLEAEAAGVQGTGIGCYFDDTVHRALGLDTDRFQDVYHFTVGGAVIDTRLRNEAPYAHLTDRARRPGT